MTEFTCKTCNETKPLTEFYKRQSNPPLYKTQCKTCYVKRQAAYTQSEAGIKTHRKAYDKWRGSNLELARKLSRESNKKARAEDPRRFLSYGLKARYGITLETYEAMLAAQNGGCAICGAQEPGGMGMFHVDHCHASSRVRGLLCSNCNTGLGHMKEDPKIIEAAIQYLNQTLQKTQT